jgi:hypothetical protein
VKQTANQGYPWPECNPPYVKDTADLPLQLKNFAEMVDDDVTLLQAQALDALNPPAAGVSSATLQFLNSGDPFDFTTVDFDNLGTQADTGLNQIVIRSAGLYLITGYAFGTNPANAGNQLILKVNGASVANNSLNPGGAGANINNNATYFGPLVVGDIVNMAQITTAGAPANYGACSLALVRTVKM